MRVSRRLKLLGEFLLWGIPPLMLAGVVTALVGTGVLAIPVLSGVGVFSTVLIVLGSASMSGLGLSGLLWLFKKTVYQLTGSKVLGPIFIGLILTLTLAVAFTVMALAPTLVLFSILNPIIGTLVLAAIAVAVLVGTLIFVAKAIQYQPVLWNRLGLSPGEEREEVPHINAHSPTLSALNRLSQPHSRSPSPESSPPSSSHDTQEITGCAPSHPATTPKARTVFSEIITRTLPKSPFKRTDLLKVPDDKKGQLAWIQTQWETDYALLNQFFTDLCTQARNLITRYPQEAEHIVAAVVSEITVCNKALIARYHPDKVGDNPIQGQITTLPFLQYDEQALLALLRNPQQADFAHCFHNIITHQNEVRRMLETLKSNIAELMHQVETKLPEWKNNWRLYSKEWKAVDSVFQEYATQLRTIYSYLYSPEFAIPYVSNLISVANSSDNDIRLLSQQRDMIHQTRLQLLEDYRAVNIPFMDMHRRFLVEPDMQAYREMGQQLDRLIIGSEQLKELARKHNEQCAQLKQESRETKNKFAEIEQGIAETEQGIAEQKRKQDEIEQRIVKTKETVAVLSEQVALLMKYIPETPSKTQNSSQSTG